LVVTRERATAGESEEEAGQYVAIRRECSKGVGLGRVREDATPFDAFEVKPRSDAEKLGAIDLELPYSS